MDKKLGVYVCSGCSIGESLDVDALVKVATKEYKVPVCRVHPLLCNPEGVATIKEDLAAGSVNAVLVAACSPRMKTEVFDFDPRMVFERANLREHVAWCQPAGDEDAQMLAEDYVRMGIVKLQKAEPLEPMSEQIAKTIMVVGGGVTGMTAALEAAEAGYEVVLVERQESLGGFAAKLKARFPSEPPYTELEPADLSEEIRAVSYHPRITVHTSTTLVRTEGQPGMFDVTLQNGQGPIAHRVGAIVMATGWKPYDASLLENLGYSHSADVITNVDFEQMAAKGSLVRPSDGRPIRSVVFVQCAGSRDPKHLSYCSSVCCLATLKHARYVHEQNPDAQVFIVYKDIRTPAQQERFYAAAQNHPGVFLTKGEVTGVGPRADGRLEVVVSNSLIGAAIGSGSSRSDIASEVPDGSIAIPADLVVLAVGMVPNAADGEAIRALEDAKAKALKGESETQRREAEAKVLELKRHEGTAILNLTYRQGPDLPALAHGFPDSHFICFPYESRRTGIYAAGAVRTPMDVAQARQDALGATLKAVQSLELASDGAAVHPRAGDVSFPSFFLQRCTQCKRCTEECPFGTLDEDEKGTPKPSLYRCRRCGICMGACPERIISFKNYSVDMIASMIKAIEVPDEDEEKPRVLVLMCENDAYPALDLAGSARLQYDASIRVIPLRCLGSMNIVWIADALSRGFDGIMLFGCQYGDDYQCHYVKGSELANRRLENVKETLQRLQLEPERIKVTQLAIDEYRRLPEEINSFMTMIREIGPNPYKGM
jgi:quinone-modifying oxidoreductase, subunit QmoB